MNSTPRNSDSDRTVTVTESRGRSIRRKVIPAAVLTAGLLAVGAATATAANASVPSATAGNSAGAHPATTAAPSATCWTEDAFYYYYWTC
ncbi:MAG: hypothetical protein V7633_3164 [Pseudonocardia sp.]|jgi:hypothetical protein